MQIDLDSSLDHWVQAELLNAQQAAQIREFENMPAPRRAARGPILIGLALGGIMLAAGVLLFVAAHWTDLSPAERMALLVTAVGGLHLAGAFASDRFPAMAVTLHAVGTGMHGWTRYPRPARACYIDLRAANDLARCLTARGAAADAM